MFGINRLLFFLVSSNFCFGNFLFFRSKIQSVKILHSKMKAGANLALTWQFSNSNGIGLKIRERFLNLVPSLISFLTRGVRF